MRHKTSEERVARDTMRKEGRKESATHTSKKDPEDILISRRWNGEGGNSTSE